MNKIPTIFKYIQENVTKKKTLKELMDIEINFADIQSGYVRILDEGTVPYRDSSVRLYIPKGEIEQFVMNLSEDYVGYINIGHMDLQEVPFLLGTWTKNDLKIVKLKNGYNGLEVKPNWFTDSPLYKHLQMQEIPLGLSVEMPRILDERLTQEKGYPVLKELFVAGFSVVGSPANASSYDIELKGEEEMDFSKLKAFLNGKSESLEDTSKVEKEETVEEVEKAEETTDEVVEKAEKTVEEQKEVEEKETEETVEEEKEETVSLSDEDLSNLEKFMDNYQKMEEKLSALEKENKSLTSQIEALQGEKEELSEKATSIEKDKESLEGRVYATLDRLEKFMNKENPVKVSNKYGSFQTEGEE